MVAGRVGALVAEVGAQARVGFHGHENLGLGVANHHVAVVCRDGSSHEEGHDRNQDQNADLDDFAVNQGVTVGRIVAGGIRAARFHKGWIVSTKSCMRVGTRAADLILRSKHSTGKEPLRPNG